LPPSAIANRALVPPMSPINRKSLKEGSIPKIVVAWRRIWHTSIIRHMLAGFFSTPSK
jgi:hypothetical protein